MNILEISGRVDRAELDDEFENMPMKAVWPFLAIVLHAAISYLNGINLPYQVISKIINIPWFKYL